MDRNGQTEKLLALYHVGQDLVSIGDLDMLLKRILSTIKELCHAEGSSMLLLDADTSELYFRETFGDKGETIKQIRIPLDDKKSIAGWCAVHRQSIVVNDVAKDARHAKLADAISGFVTRSILAAPVVWQDKVLGVVEAVNKEGGEFTVEDERFLNLLASQVAVALNTTRLIGDLRNFFVHSVELLIDLMDNLFPVLRGHANRVARLTTGMARELGLSGKEYENLFYAAYLHDIGKLQLQVPTLDDRTHPLSAYKMLEPIRLFKDILPLILHHHERYDGSGFPDGLSGEAIPLGARILAVAEDYDEQLSLVSGEEARIRFQSGFLAGFGTKYDPGLLEVFKKAGGLLDLIPQES